MKWRGHLPALILIAISTLAAPAQNNTIRGKVRSIGGATLNNAIIELRKGGGAILSQSVTRNDGDFSFSGLEFGEYEVAVNLAGYIPAVEIVRFRLPGRSTQEAVYVEITLRARDDAPQPPAGTRFAQDVPQGARDAYEKGLSKLREGRSEEAIDLLRSATELFADYFDAHFALGQALYQQAEYDGAVEALERARQINEREPAVYHAFGLVMFEQGKYGVAEYAFGEAIRLSAASAPSHFFRGLVLIELSAQNEDRAAASADLEEAEKELNRAFELSGGRMSAVYLHRARIHERRKEGEAAARDLERYLDAEPRDQNAESIRALILRLRGGRQ